MQASSTHSESVTANMTSNIQSEPPWMVEYSNTTDIPWYFKDIRKKLTPTTRQLLENYRNISPDEVIPYINMIRAKAWAIRSHMCTGQGLFLDPTICKHPAYPTILAALQNNATLIDIGTFIGQDLRRLVVDGASSTNLYALDIVNHWDLGFEMYRDKERFLARHLETDILNPDPCFDELKGRMDFIWITHVLHQWTWEGQILAAKHLFKLTHLGTLIVGYQVGTKVAEAKAADHLMKADSFLHNPASFQRMWQEVGRETGSEWRIETRLRTAEEMGWFREDLPASRRILEFSVERIR